MGRQSFTVPMPKPGDGTKILLNSDGSMTCSWDDPRGRMALDSKPGWATPRGRDAEEDDERNKDLRDGWEREAVELHELLRDNLPPDVYTQAEGMLHRLLLSGDEGTAMGGEPGIDAGPAAFRGMPRTGARDATFRPTATSSPGTLAADAALRRAKRLKAEADSYYARFPEARRARVIG